MHNLIVTYPNSGKHWLISLLTYLGVPLMKSQQGTKHGLNLKIEQIINYLEKNNIHKNNKIIFLHRDPKDTIVSGYFQYTRRCGYICDSISDFIRSNDEGIERILKFNLYWKESKQYNKFLVSYEKIHTDPISTIKNICDFCNHTYSEYMIVRSIEYNLFENMRNREIKELNNIDENSLKTGVGKINNYKNYLTDEDIEYCDSLLREYNYYERMI